MQPTHSSVPTLGGMLELPRAARLTIWGNALLAGETSLDEAADGVVGTDPPHRVAGVPGEDVPVPMAIALGRWAAAGVRALRLVLPVPGDPGGLPGPPSFNELAVETGAAVVSLGRCNVGLLASGRNTWTSYDVAPPPVSALSVAEAERLLRHELHESTEELLRLDVARWQPEAAELLAQRRRAVDLQLPHGHPPEAVQLLAQAHRLGALVGMAATTEEAAVGAGHLDRRLATFQRLATAVRRATEAACNVQR